MVALLTICFETPIKLHTPRMPVKRRATYDYRGGRYGQHCPERVAALPPTCLSGSPAGKIGLIHRYINCAFMRSRFCSHHF